MDLDKTNIGLTCNMDLEGRFKCKVSYYAVRLHLAAKYKLHVVINCGEPVFHSQNSNEYRDNVLALAAEVILNEPG